MARVGGTCWLQSHYEDMVRIHDKELSWRKSLLEAFEHTDESESEDEDEYGRVMQNHFSRVPRVLHVPPVNRWMKPRSSTKKKKIRTSPHSVAKYFLRQRRSRAQKERQAAQRLRNLLSDHEILNGELLWMRDGIKTIISFEQRFAEIALEFYEKKMDAKFEVVEVSFSNRALIAVPGFGINRLWCHVSFTAKPKSADSIDGSPKHFFGEMVFNLAKDNYDVNFCSIFEPSDPGNIDGCVFCPPSEIFVHPAHGCPAPGREEVDKFTGEIQMDASKGHIGGCSEFHPPRGTLIRTNEKDKQKYFERVKLVRRGFSETALAFYEKNKGGAEFEIVEFLFEACKTLVGPGLEGVEEWCHVCFIAKPRNVDSNSVSSKYFFGELLKDVTTRKFIATYCDTFEPTRPSKTHPKHFYIDLFIFILFVDVNS